QRLAQEERREHGNRTRSHLFDLFRTRRVQLHHDRSPPWGWEQPIGRRAVPSRSCKVITCKVSPPSSDILCQPFGTAGPALAPPPRDAYIGAHSPNRHTTVWIHS